MSDLEKRVGESDLHYHKRLVYGKLVDKSLADVDYTELAPYVYGQEYSADVARRMCYGSCKTLMIMDKADQAEADTGSILDDLEQRKIELQTERQRYYDMRIAFNKQIRDHARRESMLDVLERSIAGGNLPSLPVREIGEFSASDNDIIACLSDIHYGASHDNYWSKYNTDICAKMMMNYAEDIIRIAKTHGSQNCIVAANGDMISGSIHKSIQVSNTENVIRQVTGVSELIAQFLSVLSGHFDKVIYVDVSGNHSRIDDKDDAILDERLDDFVGWYLDARFRDNEHIITNYSNRIDPTMYTIDVRGKLYVGVHGDYDATAQQIQALQTMIGKPVYAVLMGHMHHIETNTVQGIRTVMSGSFLGMDDYCISKRLYGKQEQAVCVCDENGIRCTYNVELKY